MDRNVFPYIKYDLPDGTTFLLTPRPDAYTAQSVVEFIRIHKPAIRFQLTDDHIDYAVDQIPFHWYPWIPGKKLPTELVWATLALIEKYRQTENVIWMHCDSSSMRAPTFLGLYMRTWLTEEEVMILEKDAFWTDGRQQSLLSYYSSTSMKMDPGMKELIEAWKNGGIDAAHEHINTVKWPWEKE